MPQDRLIGEAARSGPEGGEDGSTSSASGGRHREAVRAQPGHGRPRAARPRGGPAGDGRPGRPGHRRARAPARTGPALRADADPRPGDAVPRPVRQRCPRRTRDRAESAAPSGGARPLAAERAQRPGGSSSGAGRHRPSRVGRGDPQGPRHTRGRRGSRPAGEGGHPHRHVRHRRPLEPQGGVRRGRQPGGRGHGGIPDHPVGRAHRRRARDGQPLVVPRGGGARDRVPRDAGRAGSAAQGPRGDRHRRARPDDARGGPRRPGAAPGDRRGVLRGRRATGPPSPRSTSSA